MPALNKGQIKEYLLESDYKLTPVIESGTYPIFRRGNKDVYTALLQSIVSQQLSVKAADTIHKRVLNIFPNNNPKPELLIRTSPVKLRSAGLSKQKASYLKAIAKFSIDNGLDYKELSSKNDVELIKYLTQIHGVGQWTVEMLLMFTFNRKDVFPVADVGIQNAMRKLYSLEEQGTEFKNKINLISQQWQPYRTIVCRYLWGWK